jgi:hypothetical protein
MTLQSLVQKIGLKLESSYSSVWENQSNAPVVDQLFVIDESLAGPECILDGRKRFYHLVAMAARKRIPWDLELGVKILNIREEIHAPFQVELSELPDGLLNVSYIRSFLLLKQDPHSEKRLTEEKLEYFIRRIYRHLLNNLKSNHSDPFSLVELVADLDGYLIQSDIAKILCRSEGWVSDTLAVSKLPLNILASIEYGEISYSAAVVIARAESEREREILFELAKDLDVRSLRNVLRFLISSPKFAGKKNAVAILLKMFSKKVLDVVGKARVQLNLGIERSPRRFFRSRLGRQRIEQEMPGKNPESLVFRLKISLDGENAEDFTSLSPERIEILAKSVLDSISTAVKI